MPEENRTRLLVTPGVFSTTPVLQTTVSASNLCFVALIVLASRKIDRRDASRLYTLWLFLAHAPRDVVMIIISVFQLISYIDVSGNYYRDELNYMLLVGKLLQDVASQVYRTLALLMVVATFSSYTFPASFVKAFHPNKRSRLYMCGLVFICCQVLLGNMYTRVSVAHPELLPDLISDVAFMVLQCLAIGPTLLLISLSTTSLIVIVRYSQRNSSELMQKQLISVILYTSSPNLLLLPAVIANVFNILNATVPNNEKTPTHPYMRAGAIFNKMNRVCGYVRIPIIMISTFLAFAPYRRLLLKLMMSSAARKSSTKVQVVDYNARARSVIMR